MSDERKNLKIYQAALIGCGCRGIHLAATAKETGRFQIVALADPSQENRSKAKQELKQTELEEFSDYKAMLNWGRFDMVIIASPDFAHQQQAIDCMNAGKDLLLEKPVAISYEGGQQVLNAMKKNKRVVGVGFVLRYAPLFARAKEMIQQGTIGQLTTMWVLHSVASGSNWYFHDWHATFANTGGLLLQKGSHDFDIINWFASSRAKYITALGSQDMFGGDKPNDLNCTDCSEHYSCPEFMPESNRPRIRCAYRREVDCLDNHLVLLQYDNGIKASYNECHYTPDDNREYIFIGTKGKLKLDDAEGKLFVNIRHSALQKDYMEYIPGGRDGGHGGGDPRLILDLANCMDNRTQPLAGVEAGLEAIRVGLLAHESIREGGQPVSAF